MRLVLLWTLLTTSLYAQDARVVELFQKTYYAPEVYEPGYCQENVLRLVKMIEERGISLYGSKVLYIENFIAGERESLTPVRSLTRENMAEWGYHVVLYHEGFIYDYDYLTGPQVEAGRAYFQTLFPLVHYELRSIQAQDFLQNYTPERNRGYIYGEVNGIKYPLSSMESVISE